MVIKIQKELRFVSGRWEATLRVALPAEKEGGLCKPLRNVNYRVLNEALTWWWGYHPSESKTSAKVLSEEDKKKKWRVNYGSRTFDSREEAVEWLYSESKKVKETLHQVLDEYKAAKTQELQETNEFRLEI